MGKKFTVILILCLASLMFWSIASADTTVTADAVNVVASSPAPSFLLGASEVDASADLLAFIWSPTTANAYCQYSCFGGSTQLCPQISGMTVACVNNCCTYC